MARLVYDRYGPGEVTFSVPIDLVSDGIILATIELLTNEEDELKIIVRRVEDDPTITLTVI